LVQDIQKKPWQFQLFGIFSKFASSIHSSIAEGLIYKDGRRE